jgi:signal peptidase I
MSDATAAATTPGPSPSTSGAATAPTAGVWLPVQAILLAGLGAVFGWLRLTMGPTDIPDTAAYSVLGGSLTIAAAGCLTVAGLLVRADWSRLIAAGWLLLPLQFLAVFIALFVGLDTLNPGGGIAIGIAGFGGMLLIRFAVSLIGRAPFARPLLRYAGGPETLRRWAPWAVALREPLRRAAELPEREARQAEAETLNKHGRRRHGEPATVGKSDDRHRSGDAHWLRDNIESIVVAFIMALVIRTYALEAFKIPTGSMKPTLYGDTFDSATGRTVDGDKILVEKFVYPLDGPRRWDITVFKYPLNEKRNFIKRLVGLPNEDLLVLNGDIWARPHAARPEVVAAGGDPADMPAIEALEGFRLVRKPDDVQASMWMPFYTMGHAAAAREDERASWLAGIQPLVAGQTHGADYAMPQFDWVVTTADARPDFDPTPVSADGRVRWPMTPDGAGPAWQVNDDGRGFRFDATGAGGTSALAFTPMIHDRYALPADRKAFTRYDESDQAMLRRRSTGESVADIRVTAGITLADAASTATVVLIRGDRRFELRLAGDGSASLAERRPAPRSPDDVDRTEARLNPRAGHSRFTPPLTPLNSALGLGVDGLPFEDAGPPLSDPDGPPPMVGEVDDVGIDEFDYSEDTSTTRVGPPSVEMTGTPPPTPIADALREAGIAIRPGEPLRVELSFADHRLRVRINDRHVLRWDRPVREPLTPAGSVSRYDEPVAAAILLAASGGAVDFRDVAIDRDMHYLRAGGLEEAGMPLPWIDVPADRYVAMGDNAVSSKDSRLWYLLDLTVAEPDGGTTIVTAEPDPSAVGDTPGVPTEASKFFNPLIGDLRAPQNYVGRDDDLREMLAGLIAEALFRRGTTGVAEVGALPILELHPGLRPEIEHQLAKLQNNRRQFYLKGNAEPVMVFEDTTGRLREIDPTRIIDVHLRWAPGIPRRNLLGRALVRFWPFSEAGFIR